MSLRMGMEFYLPSEVLPLLVLQIGRTGAETQSLYRVVQVVASAKMGIFVKNRSRIN